MASCVLSLSNRRIHSIIGARQSMHAHKRLFSTASSAFKQLDGRMNTEEPRFRDSIICHDSVTDVYEKIMKQTEGGVAKGNRLNMKERLKLLMDSTSDSFLLSPMAGMGMHYGDLPNFTTVIGRVSGQLCIVAGSDATIKAGSIHPTALKKTLRTQEVAAQHRLPLIFILDSAGAFLQLQSELYADENYGGRVFYNEAIMNERGIPQIAIVCGNCAGGGAYQPVMCQQAIIVKGIGSIYLAGPALVRASIGEVVTSEQLGSADTHCRLSGCADYFAEDEYEAFETCREMVTYLNVQRSEPIGCHEEPLYRLSELDYFSGLIEIQREDLYKILARLLDGSRFSEFKAKYGSNLITGFAHIGGTLIGIVANCGSLTASDGLKGANFVTICDQRNIPLLFLQNSHPSPTETEYNDAVTIKDKGKMVKAVACCRVARIAVNIGGCYDDDNFTMSGQSINPNFLLSWPNAMSSITPLTKEDVQRGRDYSKIKSNKDFLPYTAFSCAFHVLNDGVILPRETRKTLIQCLHVIQHAHQQQHYRDHHPVYRM